MKRKDNFGPEQSLDNLCLVELAKKFGTPLYVYDGNLILQRYNELHQFIKWPKLRIFYSMKANFNVAILELLNKRGAYLDTVSPSEVHLALKVGYPKKRILFTANNLTDEEMDEVQRTGVRFTIGSLSRLDKYGKAYPNSEICLRFNPDVVAGEHSYLQTGGDITKFGILMNDVEKVKQIIKRHKLKVVGLHEHTGSGISEKEKVYQSMLNLIRMGKHFPNLEFVDFGGGFKVPYESDEKRIDYEEFGKNLTRIFSEFCEGYGKELEMYFEPGKYIVAESGYLIVQVNTLKNNRGRLIVGTNSGFPQLIRPMLYGAYHHIINLSNPQGSKKKYDICGNICESGDCFATQREVPEIREGDFLAILNAGAYCYSMGSIYNLRPLPLEVMVIDGMQRVVTKGLSNVELANKVLELSQ
ncbi:MAG: diaminopimelate decarboxylase [Nanoarchaeota archaeon]|nr:diaminopimelate decarboxylase [Nanoarchaeota archaeon]MBU1004753.1 diaminopimelate decarboxylase [Nanoarchaeota archaeon]MBU1946280.1 diaminopimelate decarboxylase [Nanoarchaeota archaeon]